MYDVIIVGGGPAGITAGIYCQRANLKTVVFEKETIGGQIASSPLVKNFPGFKSISGVELANNFYEQAEELGLPIEIEEVLEIIPGETNKVITDCDSYEARAVIVATGAKYRLLGLPNEENLIGRGISFCTSCDGSFYKGKDVAVIGGANTAVTNALYMSNLCPKVYLIYRGNKLKCEKVLLDSLKEKDNIEIIYNANVKEIIGKDELESIVLDNDRKIDIAGMFISIGMDAQTNLVKDLLPLSEQNYVLSEDCSTIKSSIFVAGDCRHKTIRQLTTAMSDGAVAASFAIKYLENNQ
ncbi:MAG: FAD-dependent oxidoreductase [Bacilli bacterium]|nr:FAD-dependent oxidoreductase [Bacilli bacterium]